MDTAQRSNLLGVSIQKASIPLQRYEQISLLLNKYVPYLILFCMCSKKYSHGCLDHVARRRDCRIGALIIKASVFVRKRENLKIQLIVCICSALFGDPTTLLEFLCRQCVSNNQPAKKNRFHFYPAACALLYLILPLLIVDLLLTIASLLSQEHMVQKGFTFIGKLIKANYVIV